MPESIKTLKKPKRKRGRPAKNKIDPIDASPHEIGEALARAAERRAEERRAQKTLR